MFGVHMMCIVSLKFISKFFLCFKSISSVTTQQTTLKKTIRPFREGAAGELKKKDDDGLPASVDKPWRRIAVVATLVASYSSAYTGYGNTATLDGTSVESVVTLHPLRKVARQSEQ